MDTNYFEQRNAQSSRIEKRPSSSIAYNPVCSVLTFLVHALAGDWLANLLYGFLFPFH